MNIWISFLPGSAGSIIESILRTCTDLKTPNSTKVKILDHTESHKVYGAVTGHGFAKQWHPTSKEALYNPSYEVGEDNIFTPIVPVSDLLGSETLEYIRKTYDDTNMFYLGPNTGSEEFAAITLSKTGIKKYIEDLRSGGMNENYRWSDTELDKWELREYLSLSWMQWWMPQMPEQWDTAQQLGFVCYDTMYIFENLRTVVLDIIDHIGCKIIDGPLFAKLTKEWQEGQDLIWQKWENYVKYKDTICGKASHDVHLFDEVGLESMIQYQLREQGIELKCWNLNTFPTSGRIEDFYE